MALKITYLDGEAGRTIEFGNDQDEIRFGRGLDADIGFPDELTVVSREHFGLRKEYGGYKFIINPEKPVFLEGRALYDDQALPKLAEIQLGTLQGPRLRIERIEGHGSNQAKTEVLRPQREMAHDVRSTATRSSRTLGLVAGVAALVAVLAAGGYFITQALRQDVATVQGDVATVQGDVATIQNEVTAISTDMPAVRAELAKVAESGIDASAIIAKNQESVYLIRLLSPSGRALGTATASVILLPDGRKALATNAHVGVLVAKLTTPGDAAQGGRLVAVQSKAPDYTTLDIVGSDIHPAYGLFAMWSGRYRAKAEALGAQRLGFQVGGYDVSIMYVSEPDKLGPPLTYASRETIAALKAGDPLLLIGFPGENLNGTDVERPVPTSQSGRITSMTNFFFSAGEPGDNQLVQHSVPATGGASGSPMFNARGEVVAFLNAGNVSLVPDATGRVIRMPDAALVNYAQRADLLLDIAEGKAAERMPEIQRLMDEADAHLSLSPEKQREAIMEVLAAMAGGKDKVKPLGELEGVMSAALPQIGSPKTYVQQLNVGEPGQYAFILESQDGRPVRGSLIVNQQLLNSPGFAPITFLTQLFPSATPITLLGIDMNAALGASAAQGDGTVKIKMYGMPLPKRGS